MTATLPPHRTYLPYVMAPDRTDEVRRQLADLIVNAPWQQRPVMTQHPILMQVAQERAAFFSQLPAVWSATDAHTFPGVEGGDVSPDQWAREAGYPLPVWYGDPDVPANHIESWAAGYRVSREEWPEPCAEVVDAWLRSAKHAPHLRGEPVFFQGQTNFGVGVVFTGRWKPSWTFVSAH